MSKFTADIGCWDHGKNVDLPNATTISSALKEAEEILAASTFRKPIDSPYVVQIRCGKTLVWDYLNGNLE